MEFLSANSEETESSNAKFDAFVENLFGAVQSEQAPLVAEIIMSSMALAEANGWTAKTTEGFIKSVTEIYVHAQVSFATSLAHES